MNHKPDLNNLLLNPIDPNAQTQAEIRQALNLINEIAFQLNELNSFAGGLQNQLLSLIERFGLLYPYDGVDDKGYISNAILKDWPNKNFELGVNNGEVHTTLFNINISDTGAPATTLSAAAGDFAVGGAITAASFRPGASGYIASNGTPGGDYSEGDVNFKDGLYIGGSFTPGESGTVADSSNNNVPYIRIHPVADTNGHWEALSAYLPGVTAGNPWAGSDDIVTLGTITAGAWSTDATPIALDCIGPVAANKILGNNTEEAGNPIELTDSQVLAMLGFGNVKGSITTEGTAEFGTLHLQADSSRLIDIKNDYGTSIFWIDTSGGGQWIGNIYTTNRMFVPGFRALTDGAEGLTFCTNNNTRVLSLNTNTVGTGALSALFGGTVMAATMSPKVDGQFAWRLKAVDGADLMYADTRSTQYRMHIYNLTIEIGMFTPAITATNLTATNATITNGTVTNLSVTNGLVIPVIS